MISGGSEIVVSGGTDIGAWISGGTQFDYGFASGVTIFAGSQVVESGGVASTTTVIGGGAEIVSAGGSDVGAQISGGGTAYVRCSQAAPWWSRPAAWRAVPCFRAASRSSGPAEPRPARG